MSTQKHRYVDLDYAMLCNPITNDVTKKIDGNAIKQSIKNLLLMKKYDVPFHPEIGSQLNNILFELITPITKATIERLVSYTLQNFEPRIVTNSVDVVQKSDHLIAITVHYTIIDNQLQQQVTFNIERTR